MQFGGPAHAWPVTGPCNSFGRVVSAARCGRFRIVVFYAPHSGAATSVALCFASRTVIGLPRTFSRFWPLIAVFHVRWPFANNKEFNSAKNLLSCVAFLARRLSILSRIVCPVFVES